MAIPSCVEAAGTYDDARCRWLETARHDGCLLAKRLVIDMRLSRGFEMSPHAWLIEMGISRNLFQCRCVSFSPSNAFHCRIESHQRHQDQDISSWPWLLRNKRSAGKTAPGQAKVDKRENAGVNRQVRDGYAVLMRTCERRSQRRKSSEDCHWD